MALRLRNPHSVLAALRDRPEDVIEVRLPAGPLSHAWDEVERQAKSRRIPMLPPAARAERSAHRGKRDEHGGRGGAAEATVKERPAVPLEMLFAPCSSADKSIAGGSPSVHRLWLALDQIQDPHNVGAIFRTAAFFGVAGIIVTRDRSAPLNETVYDVASGGMEVVPHSHPANLSQALEIGKESGLWILGGSEHAERDVWEIDRERSWLLVLGNEERGLRRLTLDRCDETCRIAPRGAIGSLNVSVAAGILISVLTSSQPATKPIP